MEKIKTPILLATLYLLIYTLVSFIPGLPALAVLLFSLSPIVVIWMVYRVLKDGEPSQYTFEEVFYEDHPYRRIK
jgi:membrane protein implicated in regulation of membrane protease activity